MADSVDGRGRGATPYPPRTAAGRKRPYPASQSSQELSSSSQEEQAGYLQQLHAAGYEGSQESLWSDDSATAPPPPPLAGPATLSQASTGSCFGASPASGATTGGLPVSAPWLPSGQTTASPPPAFSPGAPPVSADSVVPAEEGPPPQTAPVLPAPASDDEHSPLVARRLAFGADGSSLGEGGAGGSEQAVAVVGGGSTAAASTREGASLNFLGTDDDLLPHVATPVDDA